jgi:hypothetical protein
MLRWPRCGVEAGRALGTQVRWHALRLLRLLRGRRQPGATLSSASGHDTAEEVARAMANRGRLWLRRAVVLRVLAGAAAGLEFALELCDPVLVSVFYEYVAWPCRSRRCLLYFHLVVLLLERVDLAADQLDLLDMAANCGMLAIPYTQQRYCAVCALVWQPRFLIAS